MNASPVSDSVSSYVSRRAIRARVQEKSLRPLSGEWVRELRGDLSQEAFAEKLGGSITKSMVSKWERGEDAPSGGSAQRLLDYAARRDAATGHHLELGSMTDTEVELLEHFRKLPHRRQVKLVTEVAVEADRLSQTPAARVPEE